MKRFSGRRITIDRMFCPVAACLLSLAVGIVGLAGCGRHDAPAAGDAGGDEAAAPKPIVQVSLATVTRATVRSTIPITGTLAPLPNEEARVAPLVAGRIKAIYVKPGDHVSAGQPIATLESATLLGQVQQAEAAVRADAATLRQARLNLTAQENAQRAAVEQARANVRAQQVALDRLLAGARPQEVAQAQTAVTSAQAALTSAEQGLARAQTLSSEGLLARKDLEAAQTQEQTARAQLQSAEAALSLVKQGNRPQDIEAGRIALSQARDQLRAAQAQEVQNASKGQDVAIAERQLQGAEGMLRSAQAQLDALTVRAPLGGTVVSRAVNPGENVDVAGTIVSIVNLDRVRVNLNVPAAQVALVRPGQAVEFTTDTQPTVEHTATISLVSRAVDPATNTVAAQATAGNADRRLRDDGFVRGSIVTDVHPGALVVPADSVVEKDGKTTVFVVEKDDVAHARAVATGIREAKRVEILSGLRAGERVVTTGAYELEDGSQVRTAR